MTAVRYHVLHETRYDYGSPVSLSQQQLHLSPRILAWQQVEEQCVDIEPSIRECHHQATSVNRIEKVARTLPPAVELRTIAGSSTATLGTP